MAKAARKPSPRPATRPVRLPRIPEDRYPKPHPPLRRALLIHYAMQEGRPRDEAVQLADQAIGRRGSPRQNVGGRPKAVGKPATKPAAGADAPAHGRPGKRKKQG